MNCDLCGEPLVESEVSYTLEYQGKFIVEHVPARICGRCGEPLFAPATVERLQKTLWEQKEPKRVVQTSVFDFAKSR